MTTPIIELHHIRKSYQTGQQQLTVLDDISLTINQGELVVIMGASGSGKSTLMHIMGCLDRPDSGQYLLKGIEINYIKPDELTQARSENFGFIFQRYHLLPHLDAMSNVEIPAVYGGRARSERRAEAESLLADLDLYDRVHHRPSELSGGQQQRVAIARSLINEGEIIFADEPTGALDSTNGRKILQLLENLNKTGSTVIIVTHDPAIAAMATRLIQIKDGKILSDQVQSRPNLSPDGEISQSTAKFKKRSDSKGRMAWPDVAKESFQMALASLISQKIRSVLTMLGIMIGITAVVLVIALGQGTQQQILNNIRMLGESTVEIYPGKGFGDPQATNIRTLVAEDATLVANLKVVENVTPVVTSTATLIYQNQVASVALNGVGQDYFNVKGYALMAGSGFSDGDIQNNAQRLVIDYNSAITLFKSPGNSLGKTVLLNRVPYKISGVLSEKTSSFGNSGSLDVFLPYTSLMNRNLGKRNLSTINIKIKDGVANDVAVRQIEKALEQRHRVKDFFTFNADAIRKSIENSSQTMSILISSIALISLIVGGIGVMNIMLVSVTERTREIGIRMAVGARKSDILLQFLFEAVFLCIVGGAIGVVFSFGLGYLFNKYNDTFKLIFSPLSFISAFGFSAFIGMLFGIIPARNASNLNPVDALSYE